MKKVSEGAEAVIYESSFLGIKAIVKYRIPKGYRIKQLDEKIRASRTKKEARILAMASGIVRTPHLLMLGKYNIWMERVDGTQLHLAKIKDARQRMHIMREMGICLGKLHSLGITHGDYTTANFMLGNDGKLWLIDFGLSEMTASFEERALDLLLIKRSVPQAQYEIIENNYASTFSEGKRTISVLKEVEKRGRYQSRTLQTD